MVIRTGIDIVYISRINDLYSKYNTRFLNRIFTKNEIDICTSNDVILVAKLANRFAAKEAFSKALGTGIGEIAFKDIEISNTKQGEPVIILSDKIKCFIQRIFNVQNIQISLSLSDEKDISVAFVVMMLS